jgi:hypothetical protein
MKNPQLVHETGVIHGRFQVLHNDHLKYFKSLGLITHVLWEVPPDRKGISGSDIRERIATNQPWEHLVPACVPGLIERWNIRGRLKELQKKMTDS